MIIYLFSAVGAEYFFLKCGFGSGGPKTADPTGSRSAALIFTLINFANCQKLVTFCSLSNQIVILSLLFLCFLYLCLSSSFSLSRFFSFCFSLYLSLSVYFTIEDFWCVKVCAKSKIQFPLIWEGFHGDVSSVFSFSFYIYPSFFYIFVSFSYQKYVKCSSEKGFTKMWVQFFLYPSLLIHFFLHFFVFPHFFLASKI